MAMAQEHRCERAQGRADPKGPIDYQVYGAAYLAGNKLVHGRVDRGVFSSNPTTREKAEKGEAQKIPGERTGDGGGGIGSQGDREELLPPQPVCEVAEEDGANNGSGKIERGCRGDLRIGK